MKTREEFQSFELHLEHTQQGRPDKVHIGIILLSTDHSLEMDWNKLYADQAAGFTTRVYYSSELTPEALDKIAEGISSASDLIATGLDMDVMAFGCTSASIIIGEEKVAQLLTKNRGAIPATNPWTATMAAFKHLNAKKVAVFSPYPTSVNYPLYTQLQQAGFEVVSLGSLGIERDTEITKISKESMINGIEKMLQQAKPDVVFMSCTNLRALDHIQEIEDTFGIPVVCSNSAMFWHCMNLAGKKAQCFGYGKLLSGNL